MNGQGFCVGQHKLTLLVQYTYSSLPVVSCFSTTFRQLLLLSLNHVCYLLLESNMTYLPILTVSVMRVLSSYDRNLHRNTPITRGLRAFAPTVADTAYPRSY
jgi:hypothetical protein